MKYCMKCGTQLEDGDKFCNTCGNQMEVREAAQQVIQSSPANAQLNNDLSGVIAALKDMLLKPAKTTANFINNANNQMLVIASAFVVIIQGLLAMWKVNQFVSQLFDASKSFLVKLAHTLSGPYYGESDLSEIQETLWQIKSSIKLPNMKIFFSGVALPIIYIAILVIVIYMLGNMVLKANVNINKLAKLAIISYMPILFGQVLGILISYVISSIGIFVIILSILVSIGCMFQNLREVFEVQEDGVVFTIAISFSIAIAAMTLIVLGFAKSSLSSTIMNIIRNTF